MVLSSPARLVAVLLLAAAGPAWAAARVVDTRASQGAPVASTRAAAVEAVVLLQGYSMTGVGGAILLKDRPAVLYRDGTYSTDAERALLIDAPVAGRWLRDTSGWTLTDGGGKTIKVKDAIRAMPAEHGSRLEGSYRSLGGVGSSARGVAVMTAWSAMQFEADGRVSVGQGAGATTGDVATGASSQDTGHYLLDGHVITLTFADGRREQRLFYFLPGREGEQAIGIGARTLSRRRPGRPR